MEEINKKSKFFNYLKISYFSFCVIILLFNVDNIKDLIPSLIFLFLFLLVVNVVTQLLLMGFEVCSSIFDLNRLFFYKKRIYNHPKYGYVKLYLSSENRFGKYNLEVHKQHYFYTELIGEENIGYNYSVDDIYNEVDSIINNRILIEDKNKENKRKPKTNDSFTKIKNTVN